METSYLSNGFMELVAIPAGVFLMGSNKTKDPHALDREVPQHRVYLSEYFIGKYPLTNKQYSVFLQATEHRPPSHWITGILPKDKEDHPVVRIMWEDAVAFCGWLNQKSSRIFRLPTEAEWEKAARGLDDRRYPWGNDWNSANLNSHEHGPGGTTPVDYYSPSGDSPYSVADMCGNVWEWCADWFNEMEYQRRAAADVKDPQGPNLGQFRVQRGGSCWENPVGSARCAFRDHYSPFNSEDYTGFRVVCRGAKNGPGD